MDWKHHLFQDYRNLGCCIYCGDAPETRDHVPSRILLDNPLPENLPLVEACSNCNRSFSLDEEYVACFLEAVVTGTTDVDQMAREKIKNALIHNPKLSSRIQESLTISADGRKIWIPEKDRIHNVVLKLARGHVAYELGIACPESPDSIACIPLISMSPEQQSQFESAGSDEPCLHGYPEIGSRGFLRAVGVRPSENTEGPWVEVQSNRYRYAVEQPGHPIVRIVIREYLACQVIW